MSDTSTVVYVQSHKYQAKMSHKLFQPGKYLWVYLFKGPTGSFGIVELFAQ